MQIALRLGPLGSEAAPVNRSGIRWLCPDGHHARAGEVIAFFNVSVAIKTLANSKPFETERTLQVAVAPPRHGRVRIPAAEGGGGLLDAWAVYPWRQNDVVATMDLDETSTETDDPSGDLRLLMLAGRRMGWAVDSDAVLLPGWHSHSRAWWGNVSQARSLLSLGLCDASDIVRGARSGFVELFEEAAFPVHVAQVSEHPIVPCSLILLEQLHRTPAQRDAIASDLARGLSDASPPGTPEDLLFAGAFLRQLNATPISDSHPCLTETGIVRVRPAETILLSLAAEPQSLLRHRKLGYHLHILGHDIRAAGPAMRRWLKACFEPVRRTVLDIQRDYRTLFSAIRESTGAHCLVLNRMSTSSQESIVNYAAFSEPLSHNLSYVAAKELNVMLDDLAAEDLASVIDVDALAAEYGGGLHLPDGIHHSSVVQAALRADILKVLDRSS